MVILLLRDAAGRRASCSTQRAAAPQLGEVELALPGGQLAVAALLDARRQLGRDRLLGAPQQHRPQLGGQQRARVRRRVGAIEAALEARRGCRGSRG